MRPPDRDPAVLYLDLDGATWRWVRSFLDSRIHSAMSKLKNAATPAAEVDFHRGVISVCEDMRDLAEGEVDRRRHDGRV